MAKHISTQVLHQLAQAIDATDEAAVAQALQAVIEKVPSGESSLDGKLHDFGGGFFAHLNANVLIDDVRYRHHTNGGGWVPVDQDEHDPSKPFVNDDAYVGPFARIGGAVKIHDGMFWGGEFWSGEFEGGVFWGGVFWGGVFLNGEFRGGVFRGGEFRGGEFLNGEFRGGVFEDGRYTNSNKVYRSTTGADQP